MQEEARRACLRCLLFRLVKLQVAQQQTAAARVEGSGLPPAAVRGQRDALTCADEWKAATDTAVAATSATLISIPLHLLRTSYGLDSCIECQPLSHKKNKKGGKEMRELWK